MAAPRAATMTTSTTNQSHPLKSCSMRRTSRLLGNGRVSNPFRSHSRQVRPCLRCRGAGSDILASQKRFHASDVLVVFRQEPPVLRQASVHFSTLGILGHLSTTVAFSRLFQATQHRRIGTV